MKTGLNVHPGDATVFTFDRRTQYLLLVVVAALLFGAGIKYGRLQMDQGEKPPVELLQVNEDPAVDKTSVVPDTIQVHVAGEVEQPGVYELPKGSRVEDAMGAARVKASADPDALNRAALLADGQKIVVPLRGTTSEANALGSAMPTQNAGGGTVSTGDAAGSININLATVDELDQRLPGIGKILAQRIVDYRQQNGPFSSIEEITNVSGIGEAKFGEIKDLISVN